MIWMWDVVYGALEHQPWPYNITKTAMPLILQKSTPTCTRGLVKRYTHMPIHSTYQGAITLCIYMIWMWDAVYVALEPQPWPNNITFVHLCPQFCKNPPLPAQVEQCKGTPICSSTAHIKVLQHFVHICGMWSMRLWNLNHDLTTSLRLSHAPNFAKIIPHPHSWISVRVHPYAHPQHISRC